MKTTIVSQNVFSLNPTEIFLNEVSESCSTKMPEKVENAFDNLSESHSIAKITAPVENVTDLHKIAQNLESSGKKLVDGVVQGIDKFALM